MVVPTDSMANIVQRTLDSSVSPAWILARHADRQFRDDLHDPTSPRGSSLVGPLLGNELPVPAEDGVGSDERRNFGKGTSTDGFASHGQSPSLIVGQPESFATELLLEDSVLLAEILDDRVLLTGHPTGERGHKDLPGLEDGGHRSIVAR